MVSETTKELRKQAHDLLEMAREGDYREKMSQDAKDAAIAISSMKNAFVSEGFTPEQAYELTKLVICMGGKK